MLKFPKFLIAIAMALPGAIANASPMNFSTVEANDVCAGCLLIAAEGEIVGSTPRQFENFAAALASRPQRQVIVVLNSPGGSLTSGLALGRAIRSRGFGTHIGRIERNVGAAVHITSSECASACAYAYLGGITRSIADGSKYGLHQMSISSDQPIRLSDAVAGTQNVIAEIIRYVEKMGASQEIVTIATKTSASGINWIEPAALQRMRIVNSSVLKKAERWEYDPDYPWRASINFTLPDGTRAQSLIICSDTDQYLGGKGAVSLGFSVEDGIVGLSPASRSRTIESDAHVLFEGYEVYSTRVWFSANDREWGGTILKVPIRIFRDASLRLSSLTLQFSNLRPQSQGLNIRAIAIPSAGLDVALVGLQAECSHLTN